MNSEKCKEDLLKTDMLPGIEKYDPETLRRLRFPGYSIIHNIAEEAASALGLPGRIKVLRSRLSKHTSLYQKIAFVAEESFHITIFDLINEVEHSEKLPRKYCYQQVCDEVQKAALEFLANMNLKLTTTARITGVSMFCVSGVLKLDLEFTDVAKVVFQAYRLALHKHLCERVGLPYCRIRARSWKGKLAAHLTIAYLVKPLEEAEIDALLRLIEEFNNTFERIDFDVTQGELTAFNNMDDYYVVPVA